MSIGQIAEVPKNIETLINNIANVIKVAKKGETIMCNVDIEDCLVKGKTRILKQDNQIDEGVLGVLELIKKQSEKKGVNFIMNFNSCAYLHSNLSQMFAEKEELAKLKRLFALNSNNSIQRITQNLLKDDQPNVVETYSIEDNASNEIKYQDCGVLSRGVLRKNIVNGLYLEDFRTKTKNPNKVYVLHFDNEVSYFDAENIYNDKAYQFLPVPIKANCINVQKTAGASLSIDVLNRLEEIFPQTNRKQDYARRIEKIGNMIISHQEKEELKKQINGMIIECKLDLNYQTDYELAKELLINERKETIAMCQKAIDLNKEGLKNIDNTYPEIKERNYTKKELNEKNKFLQEKRLQYIEEYKKNHEEQIRKNERYIEEKNKEIKQIKGIESTATKSGASDKYLKEAIFYLHKYINRGQYEATYRLDKYGVFINVNQNYDKDLMINKLDTDTIKNILLKLKFCPKNQYAINDHIVKLIIYDLRQIEIDNAKGRY